MKSTAIALCIFVFTPEAFCGESTIDRLRKEPASVFDMGMARLQNDFFMGREYDVGWFKREYKGIEFQRDTAMYWPSKQRVMIHRQLYGAATPATCTIAIETLRNDLTIVKGSDEFVRDYFWHYRETPPSWVAELANSIFLIGDIYDPYTDQHGGPKNFVCESGLKEQEIRIIKERRAYQ
jgi:hypothetical protein